jgi:hypothetical protein
VKNLTLQRYNLDIVTKLVLVRVRVERKIDLQDTSGEERRPRVTKVREVWALGIASAVIWNMF